LQRQSLVKQPRQFGAHLREPGNLRQRENAWWAREDSNLQPSGYERCATSEKSNIYRHFCVHSDGSVHVCSRRFIGQSLVRATSPQTPTRPMEAIAVSCLSPQPKGRSFHTGEVVGSIPTAPTIISMSEFCWFSSRPCFAQENTVLPTGSATKCGAGSRNSTRERSSGNWKLLYVRPVAAWTKPPWRSSKSHPPRSEALWRC
jgi:hypothetical protein